MRRIVRFTLVLVAILAGLFIGTGCSEPIEPEILWTCRDLRTNVVRTGVPRSAVGPHELCWYASPGITVEGL